MGSCRYKYVLDPDITQMNIWDDIKRRIEREKLVQALKNGDDKTIQRLMPDKDLQEMLKQFHDAWISRFPEDDI